MSGYNTNDIGAIDSTGNQQGPHATGTEQPYQRTGGTFHAITSVLSRAEAQRDREMSSPPINQHNRHASSSINDSFNMHQQGTNGMQMAPDNSHRASNNINGSFSLHQQGMNGMQMAPDNSRHASNNINDSFHLHQQGMNGMQMAPDNNQSGSQVILEDFIDHNFQVAWLDFQDLPGGDQLPDYHTNNNTSTVNPQILAHYQDDSTPIDHDQGPQWPVHHTNDHSMMMDPQTASYQRVEGTSINYGQQLPQLPVHHTNDHSMTMNPHMPAFQHVEGTSINYGQQSPQLPVNHGHTVNPQMPEYPQFDGAPINHGQQLPQSPIHHGHTVNSHMFAYHQFEATPTIHNQQPQLPINSNQHQAQDLSDPFQNASTDFDHPLPMSVPATDYNGHDNSQHTLAQFPVGGPPAHGGQPPQMPINQANFNGVSNNQQALSSFANLTVQEQNAEYQHFVQQRLALGDTEQIEFEMFKYWYIGRQLKGFITPTLDYGVTPLHHALILNNNVPIQQPMMPSNSQGYMQPPSMIYQNTVGELTTGFQHTMGPSSNLSVQAMRPNNEPYPQQPRTSVESDIRTRRTSSAVASAGQSLLPASSRSRGRPVLSLITTMPASPSITAQAPPSTMGVPIPQSITRAHAPPSTTGVPAPPSIARAQAPPSSRGVPVPQSITRAQAPTSTTRAQAPPSTTGAPAITRRNQILKNEDAQQMGKNTSREQKTGATPTTERTPIPIEQIISSSGGKYTVSLSHLPEVFVSDDFFYTDLYHLLDSQIEVMNMKALKGKGKGERKVEMLRNGESLAIVRMALGETLKQSIAHLSLDTSSDARQSLEHYVKSRNIDSSFIKSLAFAPESQFVKEEIKAVRGTEQTVRLAKDSATVPATHTIMGDKIDSDLNGTEVKGSYQLYTKTTFVDTTAPLKYAIGLKIQVAEVGNRIVRSGLLDYERSLSSNIVGEPLWADILDLLKLQATEWDINTRIQDPPTYQTSTSISLSNQQKSDREKNGTEEQLPISGSVQGQRAQTRQSIAPEPRRVRGEKRKRQQQPELHASPVILKSSSEEPCSSSDHGNSPASNTTTDRTTISPQLPAGEPRFSENSRHFKRSRNGFEMGLQEGGTGMKKSSPLGGKARLPSSMPPIMDQSSQNDHTHPARSPSEIVRSPFTIETQSIMPAQGSAQAHRSSVGAEIPMHRQGLLLANSERPHEYLGSEFLQPSRTFPAPSNMRTQVGTRAQLLREPTEAELAPHRKTVNSMWKSAFPVENKSP